VSDRTEYQREYRRRWRAKPANKRKEQALERQRYRDRAEEQAWRRALDAPMTRERGFLYERRRKPKPARVAVARTRRVRERAVVVSIPQPIRSAWTRGDRDSIIRRKYPTLDSLRAAVADGRIPTHGC
jgi:hypothetical protein